MQTVVTKNIIRDSFFKLLNSNKDIDKITVSSIIDNANISRQTFYYHFQDIYNLQEWIIKTGFEKTIEKSIECDTYKEALVYIFEYINKEKILINKSLQSSKREFIEENIFKNIKKYITSFQKAQEIKNIQSMEDYNFSMDFCSCAITGICIRLISDKNSQINTSDLIDKIDRIFTDKYI